MVPNGENLFCIGYGDFLCRTNFLFGFYQLQSAWWRSKLPALLMTVASWTIDQQPRKVKVNENGQLDFDFHLASTSSVVPTRWSTPCEGAIAKHGSISSHPEGHSLIGELVTSPHTLYGVSGAPTALVGALSASPHHFCSWHLLRH